MFAIRSRSQRPFRRSGVAFHPDKWTLIVFPTPEQLSEPQLEALEVSGPDDPILRRFEVLFSEGSDALDQPKADSEDEPSEPSAADLRVTIATLRTAIADRDQTILDLEAKLAKAEGPKPETVTITVTDEGIVTDAPDHITVDVVYPLIDPPKPEGAAKDPFKDVKGLGSELKDALAAKGIATPEALFAASDETLLGVSGIGKKKLEEIRAQTPAA